MIRLHRDMYQLTQGEALEVLLQFAGESFDAVITDPPFSSGGAFRGDRMGTTGTKYIKSGVKLIRPDFQGDNRDQRSFEYWLVLWLTQCFRVARPGSPIVVCIDWRQLPLMTDALQAAGWIWRGIGVWDKTEAVRKQVGRFSQQTEFFVWGSKGAMPKREDVGTLNGCFRHYRDEESRLHQTGKPVPLMIDLVAICRPGGLILDPFSGSASTGVAALRAGRKFFGIELSDEYCELALRRLEAEAQGVGFGEAERGQAGLFSSPEASA